MSKDGGKLGMQYMKKSFTNLGDDVSPARVMSGEDRIKFEEEASRLEEQFKKESLTPKKTKTVMPFGDKVLVRKRNVGEKAGSGIIYTPDHTKELLTDIAEVVAVADLTLADKRMLEDGEKIIDSMIGKAAGGDPDALKALITFNQYIKIKTIKKGDVVMVNKYAGTDFYENNNSKVTLSVVNAEDIIGIVVE